MLEEFDLVETLYSELYERNAKITDIEKKMHEIRDVYHQLQYEILRQEETIDNIENHIINSNNCIANAVVDLEKAKQNTNWFGIFGKIYNITKIFTRN